MVEGHAIYKNTIVNEYSGISRISLTEKIPSEVSTEDLKSMWDQSFLTHEIEFLSKDPTRKAVRFADVFCGAGGLSYGVRESILSCGLLPLCTLAADIDEIALEVYKRNFDPRYSSVTNLWTSVTRNYSKRKTPPEFLGTPTLLNYDLLNAIGEVDVLLGGPPCEGHSSHNNITRGNDPRNLYYIVMPALAVALRAKVVIVENVPRIRNDKHDVLNTTKGLFSRYGYKVDEYIVDSVLLGLPQTRKRHILIASIDGRPDIERTMKSFLRPPRDLQWLIGDLMNVNSDNPMDKPAELSDVNKQRIQYLFENDEYDMPNEWRPDSHKNGHTYPSIYGRLRWNGPAGTITTGFNTPGRGRYIHPEKPRTLTPHEAARIQGFPDTFEFKLIDGDTPTRSSLANMIGDAVPPQIGYLVGIAALSLLTPDQLTSVT